jgi:hypothetical protein
LFGDMRCIIFHSPAWQSEWVGGEQRYPIRCPRCDQQEHATEPLDPCDHPD